MPQGYQGYFEVLAKYFVNYYLVELINLLKWFGLK
jgi:hypothetical protein